MTHNVSDDVIQQELDYVLSSRNRWVRVWRSLRAAWRCARLAAKNRDNPDVP